MIWQTLRTYWKGITATVVGIATALGILWGLSGYVVKASRWYVHAEDCHIKGEVAYEGVSELTRIREDELLRKQAQNEAIAELCAAGELPDKPVTCAKAEAALR